MNEGGTVCGSEMNCEGGTVCAGSEMNEPSATGYFTSVLCDSASVHIMTGFVSSTSSIREGHCSPSMVRQTEPPSPTGFFTSALCGSAPELGEAPEAPPPGAPAALTPLAVTPAAAA